MKAYSFLLILTFVSTACKKDDAPEPLHVRFNPVALEYVQLNPSRYYIYKDSATSGIDSVVVTRSNLATVLIPASNTTGFFTIPVHNQEQFQLVFSKFRNSVSQEWLKLNAYASIGNNLPFVSVDSSGLLLTEQDGTYVFAYPDVVYPTMTVEGQIYNNVIKTFSTFGGDTSNTYFKDATYYWAKGIGIIKREIKTYGGSVKTQTLLRHN